VSSAERVASEPNRDVPPAQPGEFAPLRLGPLAVWPPIVLAPMAGVTNYPFRSLCRSFGAGLFVSEMITARGWLMRNRLTRLLASSPEDERPRSVQCYSSEPADLGRMVAAALNYPLIREASTTRRLEVRPYKKRGPLTYANTNRLLKNESWDIALSKTGYINEAGRCLVMQATIEGEPVSIVLLNSFGKLTPFGDSNRLRKWMLAGR